MRNSLVAGNWKTTASLAQGAELARGLASGHARGKGVEIVVCPPFPALAAVATELAGTSIGLGAQDAHWEEKGAFTGAVSPAMLAELGCRYVICGHSERRALFGETDEVVRSKLTAVARQGMSPVLCIGETRQERDDGKSVAVVTRQLTVALERYEGKELVVAYEPVWAIGSGEPATASVVAEVHAVVRSLLRQLLPEGEQLGERVRVLYGGSVNAKNAGEFIGPGSPPEIDGVLVGGASLDAEEFLAIAAIAADRVETD